MDQVRKAVEAVGLAAVVLKVEEGGRGKEAIVWGKVWLARQL